MYVYIIMLVLSLTFAFLVSKVQKSTKKKIFKFLSFLPFFLISAFRYDVGTDYLYRYVPAFNTLKSGGDVKNLEILYKLLNKFVLLFTNDYFFVFIITSFIILFFIFSRIFKTSENYLLSIYIFFCGSFFFQSLNIIRQYITISIIFYFTYYLFENKGKIKFYISLIVNYLIHTSSIVSIIIPFLKKKLFMKIGVVLVLVICCFIFKKPILSLLEMVSHLTRFSNYFNTSYNRSDISISALLVNIVIYIFMYITYIIKIKNNEVNYIDNFYLNVQGISIFCLTLSNITYLCFRLTYYFSIFQIISIPYFLSYFKSKVTKKQYKIVVLLIIALFTTNIVYKNVLHNDEEVIPYKTILEREGL